MYGTVAHIRVQSGHQEALRGIIQEWNIEHKPKVAGALAGHMFQLDRDPQEWIMVALFQDKASYEANAGDPEQDRWFRRLMEHLEGEPEWNDGEAFGW